MRDCVCLSVRVSVCQGQPCQKKLLSDVSVAGVTGPWSVEVGSPHNAHGLSELEVSVLREYRKLQRGRRSMEGDVCGCRAGGVGGFLIFQQEQITQLHAHKHKRKPAHCPEKLFRVCVSVSFCAIKRLPFDMVAERFYLSVVASGAGTGFSKFRSGSTNFGSTGMVAAADVVNVQQQLGQEMADAFRCDSASSN